MVSPLLWFALLGPALLALVGAVPGRFADRGRRTMAGVSRLAAGLALIDALATCAAVMRGGGLRTPPIGREAIGLGLWLDALSAPMFALVAFIGLIVVVYSRNYLDGEPRQGRFLGRLCLTLACVQLLIISGDLLQFALAWVATSLTLHGLLVFYRDRRAAWLAARKKAIASRLGDLALIAAMALIAQSFGGLDYHRVFAGALAMRQAGAVSGEVQGAALCLAAAALLKSAQMPLHGWLLEVMETPTPVSALLHAGVVNAGGFLVLRFSPLIALSTPALDTLAILGGLTAVLGSVVMLPQTSVKAALAWSTIAQMGFMMLECGLGAFSAAFLHILAHSLYKAHAFLSSGSVIDLARASWSPSPGGRPHPARMVLAIAVVLGLAAAVSILFGATLMREPGIFVLGAVVLLGLMHLIASAIDERPSLYVVVRAAGLAIAVAVGYFALQAAMQRLTDGALAPVQALRGPLELVIGATVILAFAALTLFQALLPSQQARPRWQALYVHVAAGFYLNTLANRAVLRLWPHIAPARGGRT